MAPEFFILPDRRLAYQRQVGSVDRFGIIFLSGFASDMTGTKAKFLAERCASGNASFLRFDYRGHGQSSGNFTDGTIGAWFEDTLTVFDQLTTGPQVVVGSSMGGWLGLMLATKRSDRVKAFIGIAAAPDFTEELVWKNLSPKQRESLTRDGTIYDETAPPDERAPITLRLIEEARQHLLLDKPIPLQAPVRLLQGMRDTEVPWPYAQRIADAVTTDDVRITLIKDGDHRLSRPQDLEPLWETVEELR